VTFRTPGFAAVVGCALAVCVQAQPAPDFQLADVNTNSLRFDAQVSPRDYLLQVSGYYFGDAG
jgi:hypothetical protein